MYPLFLVSGIEEVVGHPLSAFLVRLLSEWGYLCRTCIRHKPALTEINTFSSNWSTFLPISVSKTIQILYVPKGKLRIRSSVNHPTFSLVNTQPP